MVWSVELVQIIGGALHIAIAPQVIFFIVIDIRHSTDSFLLLRIKAYSPVNITAWIFTKAVIIARQDCI